MMFTHGNRVVLQTVDQTGGENVVVYNDICTDSPDYCVWSARANYGVACELIQVNWPLGLNGHRE